MPPTERPPLVPAGFPRRALIALLLLDLVLRVGTSLSRVDEYFSEGLVRGALTEAWLEGAPVWPSEAPQLPHIRGSVVMSAIALPVFKLLGPSTFAIRVGGIVFHLITLGTVMLLVHRFFGRRAATAAGALFVLAPPALAKIAVLSYGDHFESLPFIFGTAWLALSWCADTSGRRAGLAFAAGVVAGLGVGWHAQARLGVAAVALLCALVAPRKLLQRDFWTGLVPGLVVGLIPLALGDWITTRQGLLVQGNSPLDMIFGEHRRPPLTKWVALWTSDLAHALQFPIVPADYALFLLALGCGAGLLVAGLRRVRAHATTLREAALRGGFLIVYPLLFSAAFATTSYVVFHELDNAIEVRYVLPVVPVLLLPIAIAGGLLLDAGRRGLAAAVLVPPLALGLWGSLSTWHWASILHEPARDAVQWESWNEHFVYGSLTDFEQDELRHLQRSLYGDPGQEQAVRAYLAEHARPLRQLQLIDEFDNDPPWSRPLRFTLAVPTAGLLSAQTPEQMTSRYRQIRDPLLRVYVGADAARQLASEQPLRPIMAAALLTAPGTPGETRILLRAFGEGLTYSILPRFFKGAELQRRLSLLPEVGDRREIAFGSGLRMGMLVHEFYDVGDRMLLEYLRHVDPALHKPFARGLGAAYRWRLLGSPPADLDSPAIERLIQILPPPLEGDFRAGLGGSDAAF